MAISSFAADGIRADSAAKESAGNASTLPSPATSAPNNVIVPDVIASNNEGDLESSPTYVGRMFCLRPWEMKLVAIEVAAGGSGYSVGDVLELGTDTSPIAGVAGPNGAPRVTVATVGGSPIGVVTSVTISKEASFAIRREAMTGAPSPPDNPVSSLSLSSPQGTGATFTATYRPHFELRFVTAVTGSPQIILEVHEDWIVPPVSGDNWAVAYTLPDYETKNGLALRTQSGVFEANRRIKVGPEVDTARHGWFAMNDGKALEIDNVTDNGFEIANGGIWTVGYLSGGRSVNGAYLSTSGTGGVNLEFNSNPGGFFFVHDLQFRSPREQPVWGGVIFSDIDAEAGRFRDWVQAVMRKVKAFNMGPIDIPAQRIRDVTFQQDSAETGMRLRILLNGAGNLSGEPMVNVNRLEVIGLTTTILDGWDTIRSTASPVPLVTIDKLRNIVHLQHGRLVTIRPGEVWQFVNPIWTPDLAVFNDGFVFAFTSSFVGVESVEELMSLIVRPIEVDGTAISGVAGYVYEGEAGDDLPSNNTVRSLSGPYDPIADARFEDEIDAGAIVYFADVLNSVYTDGTVVVRTFRSQLAWRGYKYGVSPVALPFVTDLDGGLDLLLTFLDDDAITKTTAASALALSPEPVVTRHDPDAADAEKMKAFNYDGGNGEVPPIGTLIIRVDQPGSPVPTGVVADHIGDGVTGTLLLEQRNGLDFEDGDSLTGDTSPEFTAVVDRDQSPEFYEDYTWLVDANQQSAIDLYDFLAAKMAEDPVSSVFEEVIVWGNDDTTATQLLFLGANGFFTPFGRNPGDALRITAVPGDYTDDFNRSPNEEPISNSGAWELVSNPAAIAGIDIIGNSQIAGDDVVGIGTFRVAESVRVFDDNQYAKLTIVTAPSGADDIIALGGRIDADGAGYVVGCSGDSYFAGHVAAGSISFFIESPAVPPADGDVIEMRAYRDRVDLFVNGAFLRRFTPPGGFESPFFRSGQPALITVLNAGSSVWVADNFEAGDLSRAKNNITGEGVWVTNRGAGTYDFFTSDSGQVFNVPATVTLKVTVIDPDLSPIGLAGIDVRIEEPSTTEPNPNQIAQGTTNALGVFTVSFDFTTVLSVDVIARRSSIFSPLQKRYLPERVASQITSGGLDVTITLRVDPNVSGED